VAALGLVSPNIALVSQRHHPERWMSRPHTVLWTFGLIECVLRPFNAHNPSRCRRTLSSQGFRDWGFLANDETYPAVAEWLSVGGDRGETHGGA